MNDAIMMEFNFRRGNIYYVMSSMTIEDGQMRIYKDSDQGEQSTQLSIFSIFDLPEEIEKIILCGLKSRNLLTLMIFLIVDFVNKILINLKLQFLDSFLSW
jgi:hypothetical protein